MYIPFFKQLEKGKRFLIAGAGGGFDFVHGIPLFLYLKNTLKKSVYLANYQTIEEVANQIKLHKIMHGDKKRPVQNIPL